MVFAPRKEKTGLLAMMMVSRMFRMSGAFQMSGGSKAAVSFLTRRTRPSPFKVVVTHMSSGGDDDFFDGYDEFVSKLDFNDKSWDNSRNPVGGGDGGSDRRGGGGGGGRGRGGGGGGRNSYSRGGDSNEGHDYSRAQDDDPSTPVDVAAVDALVSQRLQCRKTGQYDAADDIRDVLKQEHGVTVWDKDRVWTTNMNRRGGSNRHGDNGRFGSNRDGGGRPQRNNDRNGRRPPRERNFGPNGHDYEQSSAIDSSVCTLDESEIHSMLAERLRHKMSRNFQDADAIQDQLRSNGVQVNDGLKQWRADGDDWERSSRSDNRFGGGDDYNRVREYTHRGHENTCLSPEDLEAIKLLIAERSECKSVKDYTRGDEIKDELSAKFDISIDDRRTEWAVRAEEYLLSPDSDVVPDMATRKLVGEQLGIRIQAKQRRDFDTADGIRDDLLHEYGVVVDDRNKEYCFERIEGGGDSSGSDWDITPTEEVETAEDESASVEAPTMDSTPESQEEAEADLTSLTVPELKDRLREAGLPVSGRKSELIERLTEDRKSVV